MNKAKNPYSIFFILITLCICTVNVTYGQQLKIKPYQLISKNKDTVSSELNTFKVPLDRTKTFGDSIEIYFVRLKSTNLKPGNPIVYLAGGPGASGIETAKGSRFPIFMQLREIADVIILDQRGTGLSNKIPDCPVKSDFDISIPITRDMYIKESKVSIEKCLDFWKEQNVNIWAYNTTENAKDLEDLRKILKTEKISFWGLSYGSHLAFEYIRLFERSIDKIVLASLEGPDETIKYPKDTEAFLLHIAALAKDNYNSDLKYPDLMDKIKSVHNRVKENPIVVGVKNMQGTIDSVGISNFELQLAVVAFYLKNPTDSKKIPALYSKMHEGDFTEIAGRVYLLKKFGLSGIPSMPFAMDMRSGISDKKRKEVEKQIENTVLGSTLNFLYYEWMNVIDYEPLPASFREMKKNKVDALLFSGTMDGRTYLSSGIEIAKKFKNGRHVIVENGGHDIYEQSNEVSDEVFNFFRGIKSNKRKIDLMPVLFE
ncbi:MAG: alpha/beta fold hydrolase [Nitrosopumilus sp.]|jgi:pimeloyl-ACP methyl ester carboxylesterase|nr:alpha/beta fold hydrolase [Nitrosopumilus sp.]